MRNKNKKGFVEIIVLVLVFIAAIGASYFLLKYFKGSTKEKVDLISDRAQVDLDPNNIPTPTPFPFQEMTIPALRARSYDTEIAELKKHGEDSETTSYLTSFDSDGAKVNAMLLVPKGPVPSSPKGEVGWPAVVFVHGYIPPSLYKTDLNYSSYAKALANEGLVVFKIDLRGHGESEGVAYGSYYSDTYIVDTLNAYEGLKKLDFVNPEQIGLWGHSMGGNVVFRSLVASTKIKKTVIWAGAVYTYEDMTKFRINDNSYRPPESDSDRRRKREELAKAHGDFDPNSAFWKQVPATNYLGSVVAKLQVHHAVDDSVVNIGYSRDLMQILEKSKIDHELFEYATGGHNITGTNFTKAIQRSGEFLRDY